LSEYQILQQTYQNVSSKNWNWRIFFVI
jgi:hypothetical protein